MKLTLATAENIINQAIAHAKIVGAAPLGIVVLDDGGHLVAFKRQDKATALRFDIAKGKARGAVLMGMNSRKFAEIAEQRPVFISSLSTMTEGDIVPSAGGVLVYNKNGDVVGAVGISGDFPDVDEACAIQAIEAAGFEVNNG